MLRIALLFFVLVHGLIHFLGFVKAFKLVSVEQLVKDITKPWGLLWLSAGILMVATGVMYYSKMDNWWSLGLAASILSQILIITFWQDARFGTLPNVILFLVSAVAFAHSNFNRNVEAEVTGMLSNIDTETTMVIIPAMTTGLPIPVQRWLEVSGTIGKRNIEQVFLQQKVRLKMKREQQEWTKAVAQQYFTTREPAFNWSVHMQMMPLVDIVGRDKFMDGWGEMLIQLWGMIPIADSKDNHQINTGALQRYLAEMVWFPSAALSPYITWEPIDDHSAKATLTWKGTTGSGIFHFDEDGHFKKFNAMRYLGGEEDAPLREWTIKAQESKVINGIHIPVNLTATWRLDQEDWTWLEVEVKEISYFDSSKAFSQKDLKR